MIDAIRRHQEKSKVPMSFQAELHEEAVRLLPLKGAHSRNAGAVRAYLLHHRERTSLLHEEHTVSFADQCNPGILPVFCPTGQHRGSRECRRDAVRKSLIDQGAFYCAWGCFRVFCFGL
ncbi:hypothetical protein ACVWZZ_006955 [Bradyrhizobium sp. LM6.10]